MAAHGGGSDWSRRIAAHGALPLQHGLPRSDPSPAPSAPCCCFHSSRNQEHNRRATLSSSILQPSPAHSAAGAGS